MTQTPEFAVLADDKETSSELPRSSWLRFLRSAATSPGDIPVFVVTTATNLPRVREFVREANRSHRLKGLFIRSNVDPLLLPQLLARADLRTLRNTIAHLNPALPRRVIQAWHSGLKDQLIATAEVAEDRLLVVTCAFQTLEVGFSQLPSLTRIPGPERGDFQISSEGSYIHWPGPDIHLDIDAIRYVMDDKWREKHDALRLAEDKRIARAIERVRVRKGLRQSDIEGLSERQVRRIEAGARATLSSLRHLARAHGMTLQAYLETLAAAIDSTEMA